MKRLVISTLVWVLLAGVFHTGCIRRKRSEGELVRIGVEFHRTPLTTQVDEPRMNDVHLYVFNEEDGVLTDTFECDADQIAQGTTIELPDGRYTVVAWGTDGKDMPAAGFRVTGEAMLSQMRTSLIETERVSDFGHLFHAATYGVSVDDEEPNPNTVPLEYMRNTRTLDIRLRGTEAVDQMQLYATARNGVYTHDNRIDPLCEEMRYDPVRSQAGESEVKCLRLDVNFHHTHPVLLHLDDATNTPLIEPIDLLALIRSITKEDGALLYPDQASLDRVLRLPIEIVLEKRVPQGPEDREFTITITIDGFTFADYGAELRLWKPK